MLNIICKLLEGACISTTTLISKTTVLDAGICNYCRVSFEYRPVFSLRASSYGTHDVLAQGMHYAKDLSEVIFNGLI
jgi:hypothetical protein